MGAEMVGYLVSFPSNCTVTDQQIKELFDSIKDGDGILRSFEYEYEETVVTFSKKEFIQIAEKLKEWMTMGARDTYFRDTMIPERTVAFCGESSWGDEPDGEGYSLLKESSSTGLWKLFDIK